MRLFRRLFATMLLAATVVGIVAIDRYQVTIGEGASSAIISLGGFPQVSGGTRISSSWFCPGAAAGDGISSASVVIVNPSDTEIIASVNYLSDALPESRTVKVEARSQVDVDILRGRTVGVVVPIVEIIGSVGTVEQELVYAAGDVTSQCVSQTSAQWFFADGFTADGSTERLVLTNPYPESAVVNVSFTTTEGRRTPPVLQGLILAPRSVRSIFLTDAGATNESRIAVEVSTLSGQIIASRIQHYLGAGRLGYSTTIGSPSPAKEWWFTSGRTGPGVTEELVIFNPSSQTAQINISFFGEGITNGIPIDEKSPSAMPSSTIDVEPGAVIAVKTDGIADLPKGDHAMVVTAIGGTPVVVEHVLSQQTGGKWFTAVTNGIPRGLLSEKWRVPSGLLNGARNALQVLNTTGLDGTFTVAGVGPGGLVGFPTLIDRPLGAASLVSIDVPEGISLGEVVITATVPVAVQRRVSRGHGLVGFSIVGALPVISRR